MCSCRVSSAPLDQSYCQAQQQVVRVGRCGRSVRGCEGVGRGVRWWKERTHVFMIIKWNCIKTFENGWQQINTKSWSFSWSSQHIARCLYYVVCWRHSQWEVHVATVCPAISICIEVVSVGEMASCKGHANRWEEEGWHLLVKSECERTSSQKLTRRQCARGASSYQSKGTQLRS